MCDERQHGQTYGEAVDEALFKSALVLVQIEELVVERRAIGEDEQADALEAQADELREVMLELAEVQRNMPFGILSDEQVDAFVSIFGVGLSEGDGDA